MNQGVSIEPCKLWTKKYNDKIEAENKESYNDRLEAVTKWSNERIEALKKCIMWELKLWWKSIMRELRPEEANRKLQGTERLQQTV